MKKVKVIISILLIVLSVLLAGCAKTYEIPWDQFCIRKGEQDKEIVLPYSEKKYITDLMNEGEWTDSNTDCLSDYMFYTQAQEVGYHSECGTLNDYTNGRSFAVTEEQRLTINAFLNK